MTHPAVQEAMSGCARLAEAAGAVGSPNPIDAIRQIDYDPAAVDSYAVQLRDVIKDVQKAIEEHEKAIAEHESGTGGSASDSANEAMRKELDELSVELKGLQALVEEVERIAKLMDEVVRATATEVLDVCRRADPAAVVVLEGDWLPGDPGEDVVHEAVAEIIKLCRQCQDEVAMRRSELDKAMAAVEGDGGAASGGVAGTGSGGAAGSGEPGAAGAAGPAGGGSQGEPQNGSDD